MYFSEQGNVDDDATFITIFLVSFNLQSCCLMQSAVCSLQSANVIHRSLPGSVRSKAYLSSFKRVYVLPKGVKPSNNLLGRQKKL